MAVFITFFIWDKGKEVVGLEWGYVMGFIFVLYRLGGRVFGGGGD